MGEFGEKWNEVFNDGKESYPSLDQVMTGVFNWYSEQIKTKMKDRSLQQQMVVIKVAN